MSAFHLAEYLEASADRFPDRTAAVDPDGTSLTYRELDDRAGRIAACLTKWGIEPGDRVGMILPKNTAALTAIFGILKAGAAYVPVDWTGPAERIRAILTDCRVSAVFLDRRRAELANVANRAILLGPEVARILPAPDPAIPDASIKAVEWEVALGHEPGAANEASRSPDDLAYILYTSGSTGVPKGVMLTHRNATSFVDWCSSVLLQPKMIASVAMRASTSIFRSWIFTFR